MTFLTLFLILSILVGLATLVPHLLWKEVIEGQVGKQSFVGHMTEAFVRGDLVHGFPIRYFAEPWHSGPVPWAEEVPLYHLISAFIARTFSVSSVTSGRMLSFSFGFLFLVSIYELVSALIPEKKQAPLLSVAILFWMPAFQIYSTSVIPDLAMVAVVAFAYLKALQKKVPVAYAFLLFACLLKYFAVFAVLALFIFDLTRFKSLKERAKSFFWAAAAVLPTLAYLAYFLIQHVPNPISEYRVANGYGHLAGPFLLQLKFYARFFLWTFVKDPNLIFSSLAIIGFYFLVKEKLAVSEKWRLFSIHFLTYSLFALVFASSFFVHDYYALSFLIPMVVFSTYALSKVPSKLIVGGVIAGAMVLTYLMVKDATFRLTNYSVAAESVREVLGFVPDQSETDLVLFVSDFSQPPIPIISKKSGWSFTADRLVEQKRFLLEKLSDPRLKAIVFYCRMPGADSLFQEWRSSDPRITQMKILKDQHFPTEGGKGSETRLVVLAPSERNLPQR